jgi:hypothetical protein
MKVGGESGRAFPPAPGPLRAPWSMKFWFQPVHKPHPERHGFTPDGSRVKRLGNPLELLLNRGLRTAGMKASVRPGHDPLIGIWATGPETRKARRFDKSLYHELPAGRMEAFFGNNPDFAPGSSPSRCPRQVAMFIMAENSFSGSGRRSTNACPGAMLACHADNTHCPRPIPPPRGHCPGRRSQFRSFVPAWDLRAVGPIPPGD